jgi:hypothetical protein
VVDFIVDQRVENDRLEYLVRWEHWSAEDDTWEAADGLGDGPAVSEWQGAHGTCEPDEEERAAQAAV